MPMAAKGVSKLTEELGELIQVCGKKLACWDIDEHWDGTNLRERMQDEMGDVLAAIQLVVRLLSLDPKLIQARCDKKATVFQLWDNEAGNNVHGIDGKSKIEMADVQTRSLAYVLDKYPDSLHPEMRIAKATEELGEVAKAVIGNIENRPGRGDAVREAAQLILVLSSLIGMHYANRDVFQEVLDEMQREGA